MRAVSENTWPGETDIAGRGRLQRSIATTAARAAVLTGAPAEPVLRWPIREAAPATVAPRIPETLQRAIRTWGYGCFAFDVLQTPEFYAFHASRAVPGAVVAYRNVGPVDVVLGEPLAPKDALAAVVDEFLRERRRAGRLVLGFLTSRDFALAAVAAGASAVQLAAEPEIDPVTYEPRGGSAKKFRVYVRRMERRGIDVIGLPPRTRAVPARFRLAAERLIKDWMAYGVSRKAHLLEIDPWRRGEEKRYFAVYDPERRDYMWALAIAHPVYAQNGWHLCHLVRSPDAPQGAVELIVMRAIEAFRKESVRYMTLGPYAETSVGEYMNVGPVGRWMFDRAYALTASLGGHARSLEFYRKVHSGPWQPRYLIFHPHGAYLRTLRAAMQVSHVLG